MPCGMLSRHLNLPTGRKPSTSYKEAFPVWLCSVPLVTCFQKDIAFIGPRCATVLDEAWEDFSDTPPTALSVVVTDGPGDKDLRMLSDIVFVSDLVIRRQASDLHISRRPDRRHIVQSWLRRFGHSSQ